MAPRVSAETILFARELAATEPLYLVSESGALAQLRACELERQGLDNIIVLAGGMHAWQAASLPVVREHGLPRLQESPDKFRSRPFPSARVHYRSHSAIFARKMTTMAKPLIARSANHEA
jgi:hypothetical protein